MEITLYTLAAFAKIDAAKRYGNYHSERHDYQVVYSSINTNNHTITVAIKDMKFPQSVTSICMYMMKLWTR